MSVNHFFGSYTVLTRKPHYCIGCDREFPAKTKMERGEQIFDGQFSNFYTCETCQTLFSEFRNHFYDESEGFFPGGIVKEYSFEDEYKGMSPEQLLEKLRQDKK